MIQTATSQRFAMNFKTDPDAITTCERTFFERHKMELRFPVEPVSAISALLMCVITVVGPPNIPQKFRNNLPLEFWLAQAGTFLNGIGSFIFHSVHPDDYNAYGVNPRMLDGMALASMSVFTALLFVQPKHHMLASRIFLSYIFFTAWSNDSLTYVVLYRVTNNMFAIAIGFPLMGLVYAYSIISVIHTFPWPTIRPAITVLSIALATWIIDRFLCDGVDALSFFHMYWHLLGTYGNLLLMCLGLQFQGYELEGRWFPRIVKEPSHFHSIQLKDDVFV